MVFGAGLCFMAVGAALLIPEDAGPGGRRAVDLLGAALCALALASLWEFASGVPLGVDFKGAHAWFDYGNATPGRMDPNTSLGFLALGAARPLSGRVRGRRSAGAWWRSPSRSSFWA